MRFVVFAWSVAAVAGCEETAAEGDRIDAILALTGDPVLGENVYTGQCATCHGIAGGGGVGPPLAGNVDDAEATIGTILTGVGTMSSYEALADQEIANCYAFMVGGFGA